MDYHRLEKGMALPAPRFGFGRDAVLRMMRNISRYEVRYGASDVTVFGRNALACYRRFNEGHAVVPEIDLFLGEGSPEPGCRGGIDVLTAQTLFPFEPADAQRFLTSRRSVRRFNGEPVSDELIEAAVRIAQQAPSVCNRQSARVYARFSA